MSAAVGDFNGDGKPDLVVANFGAPFPSVSVLFGNGDGTFQPQVTYAAGTHPNSVATGDFNGDGTPDLAVADNTTDGAVAVLLGNGDGTFQPQTSYATGPNPRSVAIGDFNGDDVPDLAVANSVLAPTRCRCCSATATERFSRRHARRRGGPAVLHRHRRPQR